MCNVETLIPVGAEATIGFKINGKAGHLQETSRFVRQDGHWLYLDGDIAET